MGLYLTRINVLQVGTATSTVFIYYMADTIVRYAMVRMPAYIMWQVTLILYAQDVELEIGGGGTEKSLICPPTCPGKVL